MFRDFLSLFHLALSREFSETLVCLLRAVEVPLIFVTALLCSITIDVVILNNVIRFTIHIQLTPSVCHG